MYSRLLSVILVLLTSCSLEEEIFDEVTGEELLKGEDNEFNLVAPAYASLYNLFSVARASIWGLNEATSDELMIPCRVTSDWCDPNNENQDLHRHTWNEFNGDIALCWDRLETGVASANTGLLFLSGKVSDNPELIDELRAELQFLRALYRYWQMDFFGQIPFRDENDQDFGIPPPTLEVVEAFNWLSQELVSIIPLMNETINAPYGRASKDAARMLLAKLYLNAEVYAGTPMWEETLGTLDQIIDTGQYSLIPDYFSLFGIDNNMNNPEAIFVIPHSESSQKLTSIGPLLTLHYNQRMKTSFGGFNGYCAGTNFFQSWDTLDTRFKDDRIKATTGINLGFLVGPQFHPEGTPIDVNDPELPPESEAFVQLNYTSEVSDFFNAKRNEGVRVVKYGPDFMFPFFLRTRSDFLIFRYADVHLMKAEVLYRLAREGEALALLNELRVLRGVTPLSQITDVAILNERGFELYWEGHRRQDQIRFNKFTSAWEHKETSEAFRSVFPIPKAALDVNINLDQNPGYKR